MKVVKPVTRKQFSVFDKIRPVLLQETYVPLRLPTFIPDDGDKKHPIYAVLGLREQTNYRIELAWDEHCKGGNWCHYGSVWGAQDL